MFSFQMEIFENYIGNGLLFLYFVVALIFLLTTEKNKSLRVLLSGIGIAVLVLFFCPFTKWVVKDSFEEGVVYYRLLWALPTIPVSVYATIRILQLFKKKYIMIILGVAAIVCVMIGGNLVYNSPLFTKAENMYQIPGEVMEISDAIIIPGRTVKAVFPSDILMYVRQYTAYVELPYGYDAQVEQWKLPNEIEKEMCKEVSDTSIIVEYAREQAAQYIVLIKNHEMTEPVENYNYSLFYETENYVVYLDNTANMFRPLEDDL